MKKILLSIALISSLSLFADNETKPLKVDPTQMALETFLNTFVMAFGDVNSPPRLEEFNPKIRESLDVMMYQYKLELTNEYIEYLRKNFKYNTYVEVMCLDVSPTLIDGVDAEDFYFLPIKYYFDVLDFIPVGYEDIVTGVSTGSNTKLFSTILISKEGVKRKITFFTDNFHDLEISTIKITTPMFGLY